MAKAAGSSRDKKRAAGSTSQSGSRAATKKTTKKAAKKAKAATKNAPAKKTAKKASKATAKPAAKKTSKPASKPVSKPTSKKVDKKTPKKAAAKKTPDKKTAAKKPVAKKAKAPVKKTASKAAKKTSKASVAASKKESSSDAKSKSAKAKAEPAKKDDATTKKPNRKGITIVSKKPSKKSKVSKPTPKFPPTSGKLLGPGSPIRRPLIPSGPSASPPVEGDGLSDNGGAKKSPFKKRELDRFRGILLIKRAELIGDVSQMEAEALLGNAGDLSRLPQHLAEQGSDSYERSLSLDLAAADRRLIKEIDDAIARIDEGTYGICERTGKAIRKERLEELPWARYSIEAARAMERAAPPPVPPTT
ncbi:MAG: TraR/DksA C4-type zinc finger protein [Planctomycetota bacterium]